MSGWWVVADEAPDAVSSDITFFIKPTFMEEMRTSAGIFLSGDYTEETGLIETMTQAKGANVLLKYNYDFDDSMHYKNNI